VKWRAVYFAETSSKNHLWFERFKVYICSLSVTYMKQMAKDRPLGAMVINLKVPGLMFSC
jgi:hypothetical protein